MSAHVLLNLLNEFRKKDKMRGLQSWCRWSQGTNWRSRWWCWWSYGRTKGMSGLAMFAFIDVLFNLVTV